MELIHGFYFFYQHFAPPVLKKSLREAKYF